MKIYAPLVFILCNFLAQAQTKYCTIPISTFGKGTQLSFDTSVLNDSILIRSHLSGNESPKTFWILPGGKTSELKSPALNQFGVMAMSSADDSTYLYYFTTKSNQEVLRAVVQSKQTGAVVPSQIEIPYKGNLIYVFRATNSTYILSTERAQSKLYLTEIRGTKVLNDTTLVSPIDLMINDKARFCFIRETGFPSPGMATWRNKIFQEGDFIYFCLDHLTAFRNIPSCTYVLKINLKTKQMQHFSFDETPEQYFRTYIKNDFLFKMTNNTMYHQVYVSIFNLKNSNRAQSIIIDDQSPWTTTKSVKTNDNKTTKNGSAWSTASNGGGNFIEVARRDPGNFIIRLGSHREIDNSTNANNPFLGSIHTSHYYSSTSEAVGTIFIDLICGIIYDGITSSRSSHSPKIVDQYFYLSWDGKHELALAEQPITAIQKVDQYNTECSEQKKKFEYRGVINTGSRVIGIYKEEKSDFVDFILFENQNQK